MSSSNPIQLNYLVFDDENEERNQNALNVKINGFNCNLIFINPVDYYDATDDTFNIDAFTQEIVNETKGRYISLVATDWNMLAKTANHAEINGLEIIEILLKINDKYRKCPFLIYSGKANEASNVLISKIKSEVCVESNEPINSLALLSLLLELKIKFSTRPARFSEITTLLKGIKTISSVVLDLLANFEDSLIVNTGNEYYDGRSLGSLVDLIRQNDDLGLKFVREFIGLSIANYTELSAG